MRADGSLKKKCEYIVLEIAKGGELFDYIANSGELKEDEARFYFRQLMLGLDFCHNKAGIAHRDLKPENLLLDENYDLKIADFGFAAPVEGRDGQGYLYTKLGTQNYMAPEIHLRQPYIGREVDLFASAIILFIMVAGHPPFTTAEQGDPFYKCIANNRSDIFWRTHAKNKPAGASFMSPELKDLINCMLQLEPSHRPSLQEILAHSWMQPGDIPKSEIQQRFAKRQLDVNEALEAEAMQKKQEKEMRMNMRKTALVNRNMAEQITGQAAQAEFNINDKLNKPQKELDMYEQVFNNNTEFFSTYNPDMIEEAFLQYLQNDKVEFKVSKNKYKIKFTKRGTDDFENKVQDNVDICVRILQVDDSRVCIEFTKLAGRQTTFLKHFEHYKNDQNCLKFANDTVLGQ